MNQGWIKLHRKIKHSPIWHDPHYLKLWMYCLTKASYEDREVFENFEAVQLKVGQFVTGRISLADNLNQGMIAKKKQSEATWWRQLKKLEEWGMLKIESTNKHSIVTICNWEQYQKDEVQHEQPKVAEVKQEEKPVEVPDFPEDLADEKDYGPEVDKLMNPKMPEVTNFYHANGFGGVSKHIMDKIEAWCNDLSHELVLEAMKIAVERGANNWGYTEAILRSWSSKKITTLEQVRAEQAQRQAEQERKQARGYGRKPIRQEQVPDWVNNSEKETVNTGYSPEEEAEFEKMRQEAEQIKAKYQKKELMK